MYTSVKSLFTTGKKSQDTLGDSKVSIQQFMTRSNLKTSQSQNHYKNNSSIQTKPYLLQSESYFHHLKTDIEQPKPSTAINALKKQIKSMDFDNHQQFRLNKSIHFLFKKRNIPINALNFNTKKVCSPDQNIRNLHKINFSTLIIDHIYKEMRRASTNYNIIDDYSHQYNVQAKTLSQNYSLIKDAYEIIQQIQKNRFNRDHLSNFISTLIQTIQSLRNTPFQIFIHFFCARINFYFKNIQKAITYLKITKHYAMQNQEFNYILMKTYQHLAQTFMTFIPSQCKSYLTKFLQMSWKLESTEHELKSYELMGKYYFYIGDIQQAQIYHHRMATGILETDPSLKKLGISKLEESLIQKNKKENYYMVPNEDLNFELSSEGESFEFTIKDIKNQENIFQKNAKNLQQQKYRLRNTLLFDTNKNVKAFKSIVKESNQNIRLNFSQDNMSQLYNSKGERIKPLIIQRSNASIGKQKNRVLMSHLSPNRELGNYQNIQLSVNIEAPVSKLASYMENFELSKIQQKINKMLHICESVLQQIEIMTRNLNDDFKN